MGRTSACTHLTRRPPLNPHNLHIPALACAQFFIGIRLLNNSKERLKCCGKLSSASSQTQFEKFKWMLLGTFSRIITHLRSRGPHLKGSWCKELFPLIFCSLPTAPACPYPLCNWVTALTRVLKWEHRY